jgi:hypothetical protein
MPELRIGNQLIQWNLEPGGPSRWVTFPVGYPSTPYVFCQAIELMDDPTHAVWAIPYQISPTNFFCVMRFVWPGGVNAAGSEPFVWLAIGPSP